MSSCASSFGDMTPKHCACNTTATTAYATAPDSVNQFSSGFSCTNLIHVHALSSRCVPVCLSSCWCGCSVPAACRASSATADGSTRKQLPPAGCCQHWLPHLPSPSETQQPWTRRTLCMQISTWPAGVCCQQCWVALHTWHITALMFDCFAWY